MFRPLLTSVFALACGIAAKSLPAQECAQTGAFYQSNHYMVQEISVEAPLPALAQVSQFTEGNNLPVHIGEPFNYLAYLNSASHIGSSLTLGQRFGIAYVIPRLHSCDSTAKTLAISYRVYAFGIPSALPAEASAVFPIPDIGGFQVGPTSQFGTLALQPGVGYDAARKVFGGGAASWVPHKNPILDFANVTGFGSSSTLFLQAELAGTRDWTNQLLSHIEWGLTYLDSDLPSGANAISTRQLLGRFSGVLAPKSGNPTIHFGGAIAGGNQQSTGPVPPPSVGVQQSPLDSLKLYAGASWNGGPATLTGSYGIQLGNSQPALSLDYIKHVVNVSASLRFLPQDHHPLTIESEMRAGWITSYGALPLSERFFGGNVSNPFVAGDPWVIQTNPLIRSYPANDLSNANGPWGGTRFFSVSSTVAYAVWGKPLVPADAINQLDEALNLPLKTQENLLTDSYVGDLQSFKDVEDILLNHERDFQQLGVLLQQIKDKPGVPGDVSATADDALSHLENVNQQVQLLGHRNADIDPTLPVIRLVVGGPGGWLGYVSDVANDLSDLNGTLLSAGMTDESQKVTLFEQQLGQLRLTAFNQYQAIDTTEQRKRAQNDLKYARHVLFELLHSVNLYSVSPAILFDVARIGPQSNPPLPGTRYALGPAMRFRVINVDITLGYCFNVEQAPGQPRGAAVLGLTFGQLF
jgi:hypothetical protein